jgi:hypothetical protein
MKLDMKELKATIGRTNDGRWSWSIRFGGESSESSMWGICDSINDSWTAMSSLVDGARVACFLFDDVNNGSDPELTKLESFVLNYLDNKPGSHLTDITEAIGAKRKDVQDTIESMLDRRLLRREYRRKEQHKTGRSTYLYYTVPDSW